MPRRPTAGCASCCRARAGSPRSPPRACPRTSAKPHNYAPGLRSRPEACPPTRPTVQEARAPRAKARPVGRRPTEGRTPRARRAGRASPWLYPRGRAREPVTRAPPRRGAHSATCPWLLQSVTLRACLVEGERSSALRLARPRVARPQLLRHWAQCQHRQNRRRLGDLAPLVRAGAATGRQDLCDGLGSMRTRHRAPSSGCRCPA